MYLSELGRDPLSSAPAQFLNFKKRPNELAESRKCSKRREERFLVTFFVKSQGTLNKSSRD